MKKLILIFTIFTITIFSQSTSVLPSVFNIQGVLRTPTGKAATDGMYQLRFYMYNVERGGSRIGESNANISVEVKNGIYNALVGERNEFAGLTFNSVYYIGISVNGGEELSPRIRLTASPYALSVQGVNNKMPSSGAMQFDTGWHKSAEGQSGTNRVRFGNDGVTQFNSRVKDQYGFLVPAGTIVAFAGSIIPDGWLLCDGTAISRVTYSALFAALQLTYGGNSTTFNLPDLKGRFISGTGTSKNTAWNAAAGNYSSDSPIIGLAWTGGTSNHKLVVGELASHNHRIGTDWWTHGEPNTYGVDADRNASSNRDAGVTTFSGGDLPHNNNPPYLGLNYIIKY